LLVASIQLEGQKLFDECGPGHPLTDANLSYGQLRLPGEVDHYWNKLLEGVAKEIACGWLKDRFGLYWQVTLSSDSVD